MYDFIVSVPYVLQDTAGLLGAPARGGSSSGPDPRGPPLLPASRPVPLGQPAACTSSTGSYNQTQVRGSSVVDIKILKDIREGITIILTDCWSHLVRRRQHKSRCSFLYNPQNNNFFLLIFPQKWRWGGGLQTFQQKIGVYALFKNWLYDGYKLQW